MRYEWYKTEVTNDLLILMQYGKKEKFHLPIITSYKRNTFFTQCNEVKWV